MKILNFSPNRFIARTPLESQYRARLQPEVAERLDSYLPEARNRAMSDLLAEHCQARGVSLEPPESGLELERDRLLQAVAPVLEGLFRSPLSNLNANEYASVRAQTERFIDLLLEAQEQGQLRGFDGQDAYQLVVHNLALLSLQDQASNECLLGDHGIRHLLDHNIRVCEDLADQLEERGFELRPVDRLALHQTMILHDVGYALPSVRQGMARSGIRGQDAGHPWTGARYAQDCFDAADHPLSKVFPAEKQQLIVRCVLLHDKDEQGAPGIAVGSDPHCPQTRARVLESLVRLADNSHAFDEKLPELFYTQPGLLKLARYLQAAHELGQEVLVTRLHQAVQGQILGNGNLSQAEKEAFLLAQQQLEPAQVGFLAHRLYGGKPEIAFDGQVFSVTLKESPLHRPLAQLFGVPEAVQAGKVEKDLVGENVPVVVRREKCDRLTPFQKQIQAAVLEDRPFMGWALNDRQLASLSQSLQESLAHACESQRPCLQAQLQGLEEERRLLLSQAIEWEFSAGSLP